MHLISYNVNGIRSACSKGFVAWLAEANPDLICLQELKADEAQADLAPIKDLGYHIHWHAAEKKGYSGVAIFSKIPAKNVSIGCGMEKYDREGRVIRLDFEKLSVMSVYMPSGSSGEERQKFKFEWMDDFYPYVQALKKEYPHLVIAGDYNICHKEIDIHNPKANANSSGFLPEERAWMDQWVAGGFVDSFRAIEPRGGKYSWWSFRANARAKNLGWRIDYQMVSEALAPHIVDAQVMMEVKHSDHCPVSLKLNL